MSMLVLPASDGPTRRKAFPRDLDLFWLNKNITDTDELKSKKSVLNRTSQKENRDTQGSNSQCLGSKCGR